MLASLLEWSACEALADQALALMAVLMPLPRAQSGQGVRDTFAALSRLVPLTFSEIASGTRVFDWVVPPEWTLRAAWIADSQGRRVVDVADNRLHVMANSAPVRARMSFEELRPHLHSLPQHPDWIPYRTGFFRDTWGFSIAHRQLDAMARDGGPFEVCIDSEIKPGTLTWAEARFDGERDEEVIVFTHSCHPNLANDNTSGLAVAALLAAAVATERPQLSWRFVFAPSTIGSLCWLARNRETLGRIRAGLVIGLLGDPAPLTYKRSRRGDAEIDDIAAGVLREIDRAARVMDFTPYGYDERQFCSPGFDLPFGRLTRSVNGGYPQYHSSADDLSLMDRAALAQSIQALARIAARLDANPRWRSRAPFGEPRLGPRGLFRSTGGTPPGEFEHALLWVLNRADGRHGLHDIAARAGLPVPLIEQAAQALTDAGLLELH